MPKIPEKDKKLAAALKKKEKPLPKQKPLTAREVFDQVEKVRLALSQMLTYVGRLGMEVAGRGTAESVVREEEDDIPF